MYSSTLLRRRHLHGERLESRLLLAAVPFSEQIVISEGAELIAPHVVVADLDSDGDQDMLAESRLDNKLVWFENTDGLGTFGDQQVITSYVGLSRAVDLDGDEDQDLLVGGADTIGWLENTDGRGSFGPMRVITTQADSASFIGTADPDGDGDLDVLSTSQSRGKIAWYENIDSRGSFGPQRVITSNANIPVSAFTADLDGDGDQDLLAADSWDGLMWYRNVDGLGTFSSRLLISSSKTHGICAADMDGDGDRDVLATHYDNVSASPTPQQLVWYENSNGAGTFVFRGVISTGDSIPYVARSSLNIVAVDLDADADLDVLAGYREDNEISWYENADGAGIFQARVVVDQCSGIRNLLSADLTGDGDMDVVWAHGDNIRWYENIEGAGIFEPQQPIVSSGAADGPSNVSAADIDGDGDLDVLSTSLDDAKIAWYENADGRGTFGPQRVITTSADRGLFWTVPYAVDFDGDGDRDVLAGPSWYENLDGHGTFGLERVISTEGRTEFWFCSFAADVDGDGDLDVLAASRVEADSDWYHEIVSYENTDGAGNFGPKRVIATEDEWMTGTICAADFDGDGDQDVLATSYDGFISVTRWYPNLDGLGTFGQQPLISIRGDYLTGDDVGGPDKVTAADLDGDGDLDVLAAPASTEEGIDWYENADGAGTFGPSRVIDAELYTPSCVLATDLDADGDLDVLAMSRIGDVIGWYENTDGRGNYGPQVVITTEDAVYDFGFAADLDGDGDQDVLAADRRADVIFWYRNDSVVAPRADFNSDGLVDGEDLLLWQAGFGMQTGATLTDGDADTDGDVDGNDFLVWQAQFTGPPPEPGPDADFNDDGNVDGDDFLIWQAGFGVDNRGDADGDGHTDGDDFLIWQSNFGSGVATSAGGGAMAQAGDSDRRQASQAIADRFVASSLRMQGLDRALSEMAALQPRHHQSVLLPEVLLDVEPLKKLALDRAVEARPQQNGQKPLGDLEEPTLQISGRARDVVLSRFGYAFVGQRFLTVNLSCLFALKGPKQTSPGQRPGD